jgi:glycosyltransferase involved in cell wall biosynthesis
MGRSSKERIDMTTAPVAVIILTYNEEVNLRSALESVKDLTDEIFIVDSFSTDKTLEIAREYTDKIYQNAWVHWAHQRNWALDNLPISYNWVLFLDADERLSGDLCREIADTFAAGPPRVNGFYIKRNFYFLGRWLKYGGYQRDFILRLIHKDKARSIGSGSVEYVTVEGDLGRLRSPMIHEDKKDLSFWIEKQNKNSTLAAQEIFKIDAKRGLLSKYASNKQRKIEHSARIWIRENFWYRMPHLIRPFFSFFYRYFLQIGFLDGKEGFIYYFLHGLWYRLLIDAKYLEIIKKN